MDRRSHFPAGRDTALTPKSYHFAAVDISEGKGELEAWKASFLNLVTFHASTYASKTRDCV
ncbi:MAG: hypothetical protein OXU51_13880 [Candidatus Poribacteria bacterium]|nr:hypothetical protein [Candidatus Poribacteria bacterium]